MTTATAIKKSPTKSLSPLAGTKDVGDSTKDVGDSTKDVGDSTKDVGVLPSQSEVLPLQVKTNLQVKISVLDGGRLPTKATEGSNAYDLYATYGGNITSDEAKVFDTGIKVQVPQGYCMLVLSRSGHGFNKGLRLANCVGLIDSDYRGEVKVKLHNDSKSTYKIEQGERIAQALFLKTEDVNFLQVPGLDATVRGEQGIGSTN